jgi:hypothetical protein
MKTLILLFGLGLSAAGHAATPADIQSALAAEARRADPAFSGFSAQRGESFYRNRQSGDWSCATCHSDNPAATGSHAVTSKAVKPIAPSANAERFSDPEKTEKWFRRNCNDVLKRVCTPREKGDFIAYLLTVKP